MEKQVHCYCFQILQERYVNPYKPSVLFVEIKANSGDRDQTPQKTASDQGLHCLLTECSIEI